MAAATVDGGDGGDEMETVRVVTRWEMTRVVKWCSDDGDDVGDEGDGGMKVVVLFVVAVGVMFGEGGVRGGDDVDGVEKLAKNNEAKMVLYNALPKQKYGRIFICKTAKDIWQSLLITHEEESIDSGFARFDTIITSLKVLDEGFSSKNYVMKFLRALHPKWRAKFMAIEESKDLSSLALDELIVNLKIHAVVMEKDFEIYRGKKERVKSIALNAKKESSDDKTSTSESDEEEYAMAVTDMSKVDKIKGKKDKTEHGNEKSVK
nr:zf-CCHC domain-containing protein/UBN2 domain-containing protein [Tanacetum cinerariifolium]